MRSNKKGFTLLEIIAAIAILSFVFVSAATIFISVKSQTILTQQKMAAYEAGNQIRHIFDEQTTYSVLSIWLDSQSGETISFNQDTCDPLVFAKDLLYSVEVQGKVYDTFTVSFPLINDYEAYQVIHYEIIIPYEQNRTVTVRGIIYENAIIS